MFFQFSPLIYVECGKLLWSGHKRGKFQDDLDDLCLKNKHGQMKNMQCVVSDGR